MDALSMVEKKNNATSELLEEAKAFADQKIRPYATQFDEQGFVPRGLIEELASIGILAANLPVEYGGSALDPVSYGKLTGIIGGACPSVRSLLTVHSCLVGESLVRFGTEDQKKTWLPLLATGEKLAAFALTEPGVGTDARSVKTAYQKSGSDYHITGRKKWITFGGIADVLLVIASCENQVSAFLVPARSKGITITPMKGLVASKGAYMSEIMLENVFVPGQNLLSREGNGFTYVVNTALDYGRYSIAWGGLGIARATTAAMVFYAKNREQFGNKIYSYQLIQQMIANAVVKIDAGYELCLKAGKSRTERHKDAAMHTTIAKYYTSQAANEIAGEAVQLHGANGLISQYPVERFFREAKILEIIEGTTQALQGVIAEHALGMKF